MKLLYSFLAIVLIGSYFFVFFYQRNHSKGGIVCTTSIIADAVKHITGDRCSIRTLMGPGIDPHLYRAKESDVYAISSADIIIYNGLHLEGKMGEIFEHMQSQVPTIACSNALKKEQLLASDFPGIYDPHIWHDVSLWIQVVRYLCDQLSVIYPAYKNEFENSAENYIKDLENIETYIRNKIEILSCDKRIIVTGHDAFAYFGRAYGFQVVGLQGISTDAQVSIKDIYNLTSFIVEKKIPALFLESSIPSLHIEAVQRAVTARGKSVAIIDALFSDSLGDQNTTAQTYHDMMKHNINTIVNALFYECSGS